MDRRRVVVLRDNVRFFWLLGAILYLVNNLWQLSMSASDATSTVALVGNFPDMGDFTAGRNATSAIENIAKGSFFGLPGFGGSAGGAAITGKDTSGDESDRSLPSLAQINQAAVVVKRGVRVYLDYVRPIRAPGRAVYTVAIVATTSELRQLFDLDRPPWAGPISCTIQVSQIAEDLATISSIVNGNPLTFEHTSIHLLLAEAMLVIDWSSAWAVAFKAARTDLVMALSDPTSFMTKEFGEIADTVKDHYVLSLKLQKKIIQIKGGDEADAVLFSKRGGLLPMPKEDSKTRRSVINVWMEQLKNVGFDAEIMSWQKMASNDDATHQMSTKPGLLEMGSMYVASLNETVHGSVKVGKNLIAFTNFITPKHEIDDDEVCMVTQMAFDKRERLVKLASAWGGVMSVAVLLSLPQVESLVRFVRNNHMLLRFCSFHLVVYESAVSLYPINLMRNIAQDALVSGFIFTVDIDFMPSIAAHDTIRSYLSHNFWGKQVVDARAALVIPAFEYTVSNIASQSELFGTLPLTKRELIHSKDAIPFHLEHFWAGQKPTDYDRWYKAEDPYEVKFEEKYEPYIVLSARSQLFIRYWDGFVGYRLNKASFIKELSRAGWRFYVLPGEAFVIHTYHDISNRPTMRLKALYKEEETFNQYLKERYAGT